jgi:hypothetical protein
VDAPAVAKADMTQHTTVQQDMLLFNKSCTPPPVTKAVRQRVSKHVLVFPQMATAKSVPHLQVKHQHQASIIIIL